MDLEVVGRHALLFDDDSMATFVNSNEALIQWNSLSIDRYDVRHLLPGLPPLRKRRRQNSPPLVSVDSLDSELDSERYLDLPSPSEEQETDAGVEIEDTGGYKAVAFSYGIASDSTDQKNAYDGLEGSGFRPPFPVPESLLQSIISEQPPTEKVHQIIARTAMFVGEHGGQSEIVLRVKQGNNPTFGFLMPDHHLHPYFRFLIDHQELLKSNIDGNDQEEKKANDNPNQAVVDGSGALSLLGSVYGSGDDDDEAAEHASISEPEGNESGRPSDTSKFHEVTQTESSMKRAGELPKQSELHKDKTSASKKSCSIGVKAKTSNSLRKVTEAAGSHLAKLENSKSSALSSTFKPESSIVEPPSDLRRLVDKIVEFILRNGKEFEVVLLEQDKKHGRFPFLIPSNKYHLYYLKALQKAQESKTSVKGSSAEKDDLKGPGANKRAALSSEDDAISLGSAELPYNADRKEKFKMILGKSKKDGSEQLAKTTEPQFGVSVDATAAAAILQAVRRGIKNPNLDILSKTSLNGSNHGEGKETSSSFTSQQNATQKLSHCDNLNVSVHVGEADSSVACMTDEQKLKAERLKRAKMFVARLKSGAGPFENESSRGLSVERPESGTSGLGAEVGNHVRKDSEGSSVSQKADASHENENSDMKYCDDEYKERRAKRSYRGRSKGNNDIDNDCSSDDEEDDEKKSRKKRRSHRSSHHSKERRRHEKRHSSSKDRESRHRHKHRHDSSSDDHHRYKSRSRSHKHRSPSERDGDLEEGEISSRLSDQSKASDSATREASVDLSNSCQEIRTPSQPPETTSEVSDDLRAKIRAMLLATL